MLVYKCCNPSFSSYLLSAYFVPDVRLSSNFPRTPRQVRLGEAIVQGSPFISDAAAQLGEQRVHRSLGKHTAYRVAIAAKGVHSMCLWSRWIRGQSAVLSPQGPQGRYRQRSAELGGSWVHRCWRVLFSDENLLNVEEALSYLLMEYYDYIFNIM